MKRLVAIVGLLPALCTATEISSSQVAMPLGIGIQLTIDGPVFVDARGMTLYKVSTSGGSYGSIESCSDRHHAVLLKTSYEGKVDFSVTAPDLDTRRSCLQKRPPLLAPANAKPIGKWSIHVREDGSRQWAYDGEPLHTSIKDKTPGEINGGYYGHPNPWAVALAPLIGAPPGVTARKTVVGLALASPAGKTLYYPERDEAAADSPHWQPLTAPVLANTGELSDWSIVTRSDGSRQWKYQGRPFYTYVHDSDSEEFASLRIFGDVFGGTYGQRLEGRHVALLKEAPGHPAEVKIQIAVDDNFQGQRTTSTKWVYANVKGMTLYTIQCVEDTADRLDCDDVGDSPRYWLSFCGGEELCVRTWRPFVASAGAQPIDNMWSVIVINPRHPWRTLDEGTRGLHVWAYRGRPVFTYAHDLRPGDTNGTLSAYGNGTPGPIYARVLLAFGTDDRR